MSEFGDKLAQAIEDKENDINSWVWLKNNNTTVRLLDLDAGELQEVYNHTLDMLYHKANYKFGKYEVRKNIQNMYNSCNAELFRRYISHDLNLDIFKTSKDILDYINAFKEQHNVTNDDPISAAFTNVPKEFETLKIDDLLRACLDTLYPISRKIINNQFIMSLGIWFTNEDKKDLTEFDENGNLRPWVKVMKERLFIDGGFFKVSPSGLSYNELRSLLNIEDNARVSVLPTFTLKILRDKILLLLDNNLEYHIKKWTTIKSRIEKVADYKGWKLVNKYAN